MHVREPVLQTVSVKSLRPTQMSVGMREVEEKRKRWREHKKKEKFLGGHLIPVIRGPKDRLYVIDHHHLARALIEEGQDLISIAVVADLRALERDAFWVVLDLKGWCHPYDHNGVRRGFDDIPSGPPAGGRCRDQRTPIRGTDARNRLPSFGRCAGR